MTSSSPVVPSRNWSFDGWFAAALAAGPLGACGLWLSGRLPPHAARDVAFDPFELTTLLVVAPVCEEVVFRLFLQGWFAATSVGQRRFAGLSGANLLTSAIFATAHLGVHPTAWAASTLLPSLVFGHFRESHRRLGSPILLHLVYNACYLLACLLAV